MSIQCKICNKIFSKLITSTHLKTHNMLTKDYVDIYGKESLASPEYRNEKSKANSGKNNPNYGKTMSTESKELISSANAGKPAWNKGLVFTDTTVQQQAAKKRELRYLSGELERYLHEGITDETRAKISAGVSRYAKENPDEIKKRSQLSVQTKKARGYDFAFFKGCSHTEETRVKIAEKSKQSAIKRTEASIGKMIERLTALDFSVTETNDNTLSARCNKCSTTITYTKQMFQPSKLREDLCWVCNPRSTKKSTSELEIYDFINSYIPAVSGYKYNKLKEIDIYIPSKHIGIEFNGLYWHSEQVLESQGYSRTKDFNKLKEVNDMGVHLIQIFEDEWINKKEIVKSRLLRILGCDNSPRVSARKCVVKEISSKEASAFCNKFHLQGAGRSNVRLGLFYNNQCISVMTFSKSNISRKIKQWELNRFCSSTYIIPGGASKLFSYFVKKYTPGSIVTYADRRWSNGNLYSKLGFRFEKYTAPGYWYIKDNICQRFHRFKLRKTARDSVDLTEKEIRAQEGYNVIWDCGNSKWIWQQK